MNETLPAIAFSILIIIALALGYLVGHGRGHESENTAGSSSAHQPDSADYKRGV